MFETADKAEIPIPEGLRADGERGWAYVEFPLHVPWFHVVYRLPLQEGGHLIRSLFLAQVSALVRFCSQLVRVHEVQVVLPGRITGACRWTMEPLAEIWEGVEPRELGHPVCVYVLENGKRYIDSAFVKNEANLLDRQLIFKNPREDK